MMGRSPRGFWRASSRQLPSHKLTTTAQDIASNLRGFGGIRTHSSTMRIQGNAGYRITLPICVTSVTKARNAK